MPRYGSSPRLHTMRVLVSPALQTTTDSTLRLRVSYKQPEWNPTTGWTAVEMSQLMTIISTVLLCCSLVARGPPPLKPIRPGICRSFVQPPEHRRRDLEAVGFTPSIHSWEMVQLIRTITTQSLPAAGFLPLFSLRAARSESCRSVWLAVWISATRYPSSFLFRTLPAQRFWRRERHSGKHTAPPHLRGGGTASVCSSYMVLWLTWNASYSRLYYLTAA